MTSRSSRPLDPTDPEQLEVWASSLSKSRRRQVAIIKDMIRDAIEEDMSPLDYTFVVAAYRWLVMQKRLTRKTSDEDAA